MNDIDLGLDGPALPYDDEADVMVYAAELGYRQVWIGSVGDPFQTCALRWAASRAATTGGIGTAIGVIPVAQHTAVSLATSGAALSRLTGGRFTLGIGVGSAYESKHRRTWGVTEPSAIRLARAYLTTIRAFVAGESVTYHGSGIEYENAQSPYSAPSMPLYLGANGPRMASLAGEIADGVYLSWCNAESIRATRAAVDEGATRVDRSPSEVTIAASVRVCIDADRQAARRSLAASLLPYVIGWGGTPPIAYRRSFERMGFGPELAAIDRMTARGDSREQILEAFPDRLVEELGYGGPATEAADAVHRLTDGADKAVVRIVPSQPTPEAIRAVVEACRPSATDVETS